MKHKNLRNITISCLLAAILSAQGACTVQAVTPETTDPDYEPIWSEPQIIITDGTELTTDILNNVPYSKELDSDGHFFNIYSVEEMETISGAIAWAEPHIRELMETKGGCGEEAKIYLVLCNHTERSNVPALLRRIELNNPCVLEVKMATSKNGTARRLVGSGAIYSTTSSVVSAVYKDERYLAWRAQEAEWLSACNACLENLDSTDMSDSEIDALLHDQGLMTTYELRAEAERCLTPIVEDPAYGGRIAYETGYHFGKTYQLCGYLDAWDVVGDFDGDGAVNASDASRILTAAAKAGTGTEALGTPDMIAGDVNADGLVNASDASIILQYAASAGLQAGTSLKDFLKR